MTHVFSTGEEILSAFFAAEQFLLKSKYQAAAVGLANENFKEQTPCYWADQLRIPVISEKVDIWVIWDQGMRRVETLAEALAISQPGYTIDIYGHQLESCNGGWRFKRFRHEEKINAA